MVHKSIYLHTVNGEFQVERPVTLMHRNGNSTDFIVEIELSLL